MMRSPTIVPFVFKRDYVEFILIEMDRFDQPMTRTLLSFLQKRYGDEFWYAIDIEGDGRLDAYLIAGSEQHQTLGQVIHIYSIAVRRQFEGQGWATKMMHKLFTDAKGNNHTAIILEVRENNSRALQFYKKLNFEISGSVKDYYKDGLDAITMQYLL